MCKIKRSSSEHFYLTFFDPSCFVFADNIPETPYFQEKLLQIIWNEGFIQRPLYCEDGQSLEIIHPGIWNKEAGPDFHSALIVLNGQRKYGSIELHQNPDDWCRHRHGVNPDYDNIILHVVWNNPKDYCHYPSHVPIFSLSRHLSLPLFDVMHRVDYYGYEKKLPASEWAHYFLTMEDAELKKMLYAYGISRMVHKAWQLAEEIEHYGAETTLYRLLFKGMGYKSNVDAFVALSRRIELSDLIEVSDETSQALLFGAAGLLPDPSQTPIKETYQHWVDRMWDIWGPRCKGYQEIKWQSKSRRPYNRPERRLLAAYFLLRQHEFRLAEKIINVFSDYNTDISLCLSTLEDCFQLNVDRQWGRFLNFQHCLPRSAQLIGRQRRNDLIVNLAFPFYAADCLLNNRLAAIEVLESVFMKVKKLQDNRKLKDAAQLFFISPDQERTLVHNACAQQGLLHLYALYQKALQKQAVNL